LDVAGYVRSVLAGTSEEWPERDEVIELSSRVPVRSIREELATIAGGPGSDAFRATVALAEAGDARAAPALLEAAESGDEQAAELLARLDVTAVAEDVRDLIGRLPRPVPPTESGTESSRARLYEAADAGMRRFWLALALARAGDDDELRAFVEDERAGRAITPLFWGQPEVGWARIRAGGPVPDILRPPSGDEEPAEGGPPR
jgi:hypothetical protein